MMEVPTVTQEDILQFHQIHFTSATNSSTVIEEDPQLYYEDGNVRTLTDEQIAIFRQSEIYALVRKQDRAAQAGEDGESSPTPTPTPTPTLSTEQKSSTSGHKRQKRQHPPDTAYTHRRLARELDCPARATGYTESQQEEMDYG